MDEHDAPAGRPAHRRFRRGLVATAGAAALIVAGLGVASAQTDPSAPTTTTTASSAPAKQAAPGHFRGRSPGHKAFPGFPGGPGGIHGEHTIKNPTGEGYRTVATQVGEVVSVSPSKIEVKSEDGYSRTYKVDEDTLVNAGRDGIADVKNGDEVHVTALVTDGTASAKRVADLTNLERFRQNWGHKRPR